MPRRGHPSTRGPDSARPAAKRGIIQLMTSADPSVSPPIGTANLRRWSDEWWEFSKGHRCTAHRSTDGQRCQRPACRGTVVCTHHGGRAPAVKAKARRRLEEASDRLARQLLGIAEGAESEAVRLAAVKDALDRAGVQAKTAATVEVSVKPWETVLEGISNSEPLSRRHATMRSRVRLSSTRRTSR